MKFRDAIEKRCDVKRFDLKKPNWRKVVRAVDAARFSSSAGNHFAVRFILVTDESAIDKISKSCQQDFISGSKCVVVAVSDPSSLIRSYGDRATKYCELQAGAAIQNFLLGLENEGLVTSWVWYYVDEEVKRILDIPEGASVQGIFPIGGKTKVSGKAKRNAKLENVLFFGKYGERKMRPKTEVTRDSV
ncbi:nitroreductase family protein [archaeon]|jgi:nitroreductase|nr:nitroreductase family protein [archaeon]MBT7128336.1 nitroreductase family protein [archaeon]